MKHSNSEDSSPVPHRDERAVNQPHDAQFLAIEFIALEQQQCIIVFNSNARRNVFKLDGWNVNSSRCIHNVLN